jgi:hypothetical protein
MDNENIIYVDADTREAVLHSNFKIGVVNDDSCHTLTFRINKASDIDLTDLTFYVNTTSSRGNGDKLDCTKEEDGQYIFVKCLLKGTLFEAKGKATINLCGRKYDSNNAIIKKWGSEDITVLVGSHTDADKAIEERYPSVLEELRQKVNNPNLTDEQLSVIATKVAAKGFYTKSEVDALVAKIVVPTKLSQLADDTTHRLVTDDEKQKWNNKSDFNGSYNSLTNKPIIPSNLSQLAEDDSHMTVTKSQRDKIDNFTGGSGTGTSITVDTALSSTSVNPVANKAVTNALNAKAEKSELGIDIVNTSQSTITMQSGKYYVFGEMASINVTCEATPSGKAFICGFEFTSGAAPTSLTLNKCTLTSDSDDVVANKTYEVNILNGSAIVRAR